MRAVQVVPRLRARGYFRRQADSRKRLYGRRACQKPKAIDIFGRLSRPSALKEHGIISGRLTTRTAVVEARVVSNIELAAEAVFPFEP